MEHLPIVLHPDQVQPSESRLYFFDANVWIQILFPYDADPKMRPYKTLWQQIAEKGEPFIVVNPVLLSEIFNRYLRIKFDTWKAKESVIHELRQDGKLGLGHQVQYKRHFRPHPDHKEYVGLLLSELQAYEYFIKYPEQEVDSTILPSVIQGFKSDSDFNDKYYIEFCKALNLRVVSHDGDFYTGGIELVTLNEKTWRKHNTSRKKQQ